MMLEYCDYIAYLIRTGLIQQKPASDLVAAIGPIQSDLHPQEGYFLSSKKIIDVRDANGRQYKVTVECVG